jgi:hypothetical protein
MTPCDHLKADTWPLTIEHTFTMLVVFADALARCRSCGQNYLLELLDVRGHERLYRLSCSDAELSHGLITDLNRGSCDLQRAQAQFDEFSRQSLATEALLWTDSRASSIRGLITTDLAIPVEHWQALPCDGAWFKRLALIEA